MVVKKFKSTSYSAFEEYCQNVIIKNAILLTFFLVIFKIYVHLKRVVAINCINAQQVFTPDKYILTVRRQNLVTSSKLLSAVRICQSTMLHMSYLELQHQTASTHNKFESCQRVFSGAAQPGEACQSAWTWRRQ